MPKSLIPSFVLEQGIANQCLTRGADFEAYTGPMTVDASNNEEQRYLVHMVGSSTVMDLQGDIMLLSALDDMTKIPDNLTILLNHEMTIPDSVFGGLVGRPSITTSAGIADLHLSAETEISNPRAMQTYTMISRGRRLGCSVGCLVLDYEYDEDKDALLLKSVRPVEFSICSIPANQRCWVEVASKSLFERSLLEGRGDDALKLAPAIKGMFWKAYESIVKHVESTGLKADLEHVTPRNTPSHRIIYDFTDSSEGFALVGTKGAKKALSREEVGVLIEKSVQPSTPKKREEDTVTKGVCGNTSLPLMDIGTAWDGSKAEKQILAWAKGDNDEINVAKAKQGFLWYDPDNSDKQSGYKLPMCFVDGTPKIVPLGVRAVAGAMSGARGGASVDDEAAIKAKVKTLYGRINSQFKPDPKWQVPWENKEDAVNDVVTKDIADTTSDAPLNRQDLGEEEAMKDKAMPKASEVSIGDDGSHDACNGSHSHSHKSYGSQGDDDMHAHEHSHDGDASHSHSHSEKAIDDRVPKSIDEPTPTLVETSNSTEITVIKDPLGVDEVSDQKTMLHSIYKALISQASSIGAQIGIEPIVLDKAIMPVNMNPQDVISTISQLDTLVDSLMAGFGIPDIDDDTETPMSAQYSIEAQVTKALSAFFKIAEGKEHSKQTLQKFQAIHDTVKSLHAGVCDGDGVQHQTESTTQDEANARAREDDQMKAYQDGIGRQVLAIDNFVKSLESMGVRDLVDSSLNKALQESRATIAELRKEQDEVAHRLDTLRSMPLGRPTTFVGRTVEPDDSTASYADMLSSKGGSMNYEDVLSLTKTEKHNGMLYRAWPEGVGGDIATGVRPRLTEAQKTYMAPMDIVHYNEGRATMVPVFDEGTM